MSLFLAGRFSTAGSTALVAAVAFTALMPQAHARSQFSIQSNTQAQIILIDDDDDDDRRRYFHRHRNDDDDWPRYRGFSRGDDDDDDDDD